MASVKKIEKSAIVNLLRHNSREIKRNKNQSIDSDLSDRNMQLFKESAHASFERFKHRRDELYFQERTHSVQMAEWVISAPEHLPPDMEKAFFTETIRFLMNRYGKENVIQATLHRDEPGTAERATRSHLHFDFIPVVKLNPKKTFDAKAIEKGYTEKLSYGERMNRTEYRRFHKEFQQHMSEAGFGEYKVYGVEKNIEQEAKVSFWSSYKQDDISI